MRLRHNPFYSALLAPKALVAEIENPNFEVTIFPIWFKNVTIGWKIPDDWGNCTFNVYRSKSDSGDFKKLNTTPIDSQTFEDVEARMWSKYDHDFYIVEAILHDHGGAFLRSKPYSWERQQRRWVELRSIEIQRRFWLMLNKFMGVETYVFKRRSYGNRCDTCWDYKNLKVTNDRCPECLGTGWKGGYLTPYLTRVQYDATPNNKELSHTGRNEPSVIAGVTIAFPSIDDWDLIYRVKDNKMYRVDKVLTTELLTSIVSQRLQLIELPKNYVEFRLSENLR